MAGQSPGCLEEENVRITNIERDNLKMTLSYEKQQCVGTEKRYAEDCGMHLILNHICQIEFSKVI